ncbi:MAG: helix-turn-helix transcriptional regulator [Mucilaginibacter sp.]|uniref:helix-turn-helix domain-containing protein n=1 Tax=Mucilaginibacter sp. TaxID=1882438 RepID=UPI003266C257
MDLSENNTNLSILVGRNVTSLRTQASLTIEGLTFALSISISYTLMIERGKANISSKLATKIANLFGIEVAQIYSAKKINLKAPQSISPIEKFYDENKQNAKFFIHRRNEYSVASFVRNILLLDPVMNSEHTVGEIKEYCAKKYKRELDSQELSREIRRLFLKNILQRRDKFGNGSVYFYFSN